MKKRTGELTYRIYSGRTEVSDGEESVTNDVIPDKIDGLPVTVIGDFCIYVLQRADRYHNSKQRNKYRAETFLGCSSLTGITIPNSVTSIGICAFRACSDKEV